MTSISMKGISTFNRIANSISICRSTVTALVLVAGSLMLGGCQSDSPVQSSAVGVRPPAAGSVFVYRFRGTYREDTTECFDTVTVEKTGLRLGGRSNVIEMHTAGTFEGYSYICYEPNGDISFAQVNGYRLNADTAPDDVYWVTFPLASRNMTTTNSPDSTEIDGTMQPSLVYEVRANGPETINDGGLPVASEKFDVTGLYARSGGPHILTMHYWISSATGVPSKSVILRDGMLEEQVLVSQTIR